jgi:signal transduction histidine kinase
MQKMNTERLIDTTSHHLPQGMMLLDISNDESGVTHLVVRKTNQAFEKLFNITSDEIKNRRADDVFPKIFGNSWDWNKQFLNGEENHLSFYHDQLDRYFEVDTLKLTNDQIVSVFVDASSKQRMIQELEEVKTKVEESNRLKIAFLSSITHEIRTPMNAIIGFSKMIGSSEYNAEEKGKFVDIIISNGKILLALINDMISLSQIESNTFVVKKSLCKVNDLMDALYLESGNDLEDKSNISLKVSCESSDPNFTITTDSALLQTIVKKLIDNGIKFTEKGEVEFGYRVLNSNYLEFFVRDTGIGIAEDDQDRIFERFHQLDSRLNRAYEGTGLGLSIAQHAVRLLGGTLQVDSKPGIGSTFKFTIPSNLTEGSSPESVL